MKGAKLKLNQKSICENEIQTRTKNFYSMQTTEEVEILFVKGFVFFSLTS